MSLPWTPYIQLLPSPSPVRFASLIGLAISDKKKLLCGRRNRRSNWLLRQNFGYSAEQKTRGIRFQTNNYIRFALILPGLGINQFVSLSYHSIPSFFSILMTLFQYFAAPERVYTTEAWAAPGRVYTTKACAEPGHIYTTGARAAPWHVYTTEACAASRCVYTAEACADPWTSLDNRSLCCSWMCLSYRGVSCTWMYLDFSSLCCS